MKYELHALGEKFIVEQGVEIGGADVEEAADIALAFRRGGTFTILTTHGEITFNVPDGGIPVWVKPIRQSDTADSRSPLVARKQQAAALFPGFSRCTTTESSSR